MMSDILLELSHELDQVRQLLEARNVEVEQQKVELQQQVFEMEQKLVSERQWLLEKKMAEQVKNSPKLKQDILSERPVLAFGNCLDICSGCKLPLPSKLLEIDHIMPKARGGDESRANRTLLCSWCNRSKGKKTWDEWKGEPFNRNIIYPRILIPHNGVGFFDKLMSKDLGLESHLIVPNDIDDSITSTIDLKNKDEFRIGTLRMLQPESGHIVNFQSRNTFENFFTNPEFSMEDIGDPVITFIGYSILEC